MNACNNFVQTGAIWILITVFKNKDAAICAEEIFFNFCKNSWDKELAQMALLGRLLFRTLVAEAYLCNCIIQTGKLLYERLQCNCWVTNTLFDNMYFD